MSVECQGEPKIADHNIIVYKCFRKEGIFLLSPFHDKLVVWLPFITYRCRGFKYTEKAAVTSAPVRVLSKDGYYSVNNWANLEKELGKLNPPKYNNNIVIRECLIPAGTKYYWYAGEYCSEYLRIISTKNLETNDTSKNVGWLRNAILRHKKFFRRRPEIQ